MILYIIINGKRKGYFDIICCCSSLRGFILWEVALWRTPKKIQQRQGILRLIRRDSCFASRTRKWWEWRIWRSRIGYWKLGGEWRHKSSKYGCYYYWRITLKLRHRGSSHFRNETKNKRRHPLSKRLNGTWSEISKVLGRGITWFRYCSFDLCNFG